MNFHSYCNQETSNNNNNKEALTAFLNRLFVVTTGVSTLKIWDQNAQLWSHSGHTHFDKMPKILRIEEIHPEVMTCDKLLF